MPHVVVHLATAVALTFGISAMTALIARSEEQRRLTLWSVLLTLAVMVALFVWADLPLPADGWLATIGVGGGLLSIALLKAARWFDRRVGMR
jgi:hypothetical protein